MTYNIQITPLTERKAIIAKRLEASTVNGSPIYDFRGDTFTPKIVRLPVSLPIYRMENCRTFSAQQSVIAQKSLPADYFLKGQEQAEAQQIQHGILSKLSKQGTKSVTPIYGLLELEGQRVEILLSSSGVVVNGNRRLSAMRELYATADDKDKERFSHVSCAILPPDTTRDEIDDIEADEQARPQSKLEYDWIGDAQLIRRQVNKPNNTEKLVARRLRRSESEIKNILQALDEADLYLSEWVEQPGRYELVSEDGQQIFGDIPKNIAKKDQELQDASRAIAWSLFENRDRISGRVYNLNPAFGKLAPQVLDILSEQLDIGPNDGTVDEDEGDFSFSLEDEDDVGNYDTLIEALKNPETKDDSVSALIEACETAIELDKGKKSEKAALNALNAAHSKLSAVDVDGAGVQYLNGMQKQIDSIRKVLEKIEAKISARQNKNSQSG